MEIHIPYAKKGSNLIHIDEVESGLHYDCRCVVCEDALIARKGNIRVHHFAHKSNFVCTGESQLHKIAKMLLFDKIKSAIEGKKPLPFQWECIFCHEDHKANLVKKTLDAKMEFPLDDARPDIALFDSNGKIYTVIEIIVSHYTEESALDFYKKQGIIRLDFPIKDGADLDKIKEDVLKPGYVDFCLMPRCPKCGSYMYRRKIYLLDGRCWNCGKPMIIAVGRNLRENEYFGPPDFSQTEIDAAKQLGAFFVLTPRPRTFPVSISSYSIGGCEGIFRNVCNHCHKVFGGLYNFGYVDLLKRIQTLEIEKGCSECEGKARQIGQNKMSNELKEKWNRLLE